RGRGLHRPRLCLPPVLQQHVVRTTDRDRKSTRLNSSHSSISYAVFCLKITTEPPYRSKPTYARAVFGPQARAKVGLFLDGVVLYVDKIDIFFLKERDTKDLNTFPPPPAFRF